MAKNTVIVGDTFGGMDAEFVKASETTDIIEARAKAREGSVKANLAYVAITLGVLFLVGAAGIGIVDGSFNELEGVWLAGGPVVGGVFVYYFGSEGKKNGSKSNSG